MDFVSFLHHENWMYISAVIQVFVCMSVCLCVWYVCMYVCVCVCVVLYWWEGALWVFGRECEVVFWRFYLLLLLDWLAPEGHRKSARATGLRTEAQHPGPHLGSWCCHQLFTVEMPISEENLLFLLLLSLMCISLRIKSCVKIVKDDFRK